MGTGVHSSSFFKTAIVERQRVRVKGKYSIYCCCERTDFDLADLRAFLAAADLGSFKAASAMSPNASLAK
jgi:hypothetical protein